MASSAFPPSAFCNKNKRTRQDEDSDSGSDNEPSMIKDKWPRFIVVKSASEENSFSQLSPFTVQKGFKTRAGTLKNAKRLRDGPFLVECSRRAQADNLLRTVNFADRPVHVFVRKTLNSSRGVIRCRELSDMSEA